MFCFHFMAVIITILFGQLLRFEMVKADQKNSGYNVCYNLIDESSSPNDTNILTVGQINSDILLITKDFWVFDISSDALKGEQNSSAMYLGSNPDPMSEKWPVLWNNEKFIQTKDHIYNSFTVTDSTSQYVFFTTKKEEFDKVGVTYDIGNDNVRSGLTYFEHDDQVMISATEKMIFYAINSDGKGLRIGKYKFKHDSIHKGLSLDGDWKRLCAVSGESSTESKVPAKIKMAESCENEISWSVYRGFNDGDQFYLFGPQNLLIFSMETVFSPGEPHDLVEKKYDNFFVCQPDYGRIIFIVLGVLLLLALLALLIYCCCCRRKKKNTSTKSSSPYLGNFNGAKSNKKKPKNKKSKSKSLKSGAQTKRSDNPPKNAGHPNHPGSVGPSMQPNVTNRSKFGSNKSRKKSQKGSRSKSKQPNRNSKSTRSGGVSGTNSPVTGRSAFGT